MRPKILAVGAVLCAAVIHGAVSPAADLNNPTGIRGIIFIDKRGGQVRFADPNSYAETGALSPGTQPHDLALSPDHRYAYVTIYGDGVYGKNPHPGHQIAVIDVEARKLIRYIDVAPYQAPHGIQIDSDGKLYVTCDLSRKLLVILPETGIIDAAIDTEGTGHWVALLAQAHKAYIANKTDKPYISVIDLQAKKVANRIPMPNGTQGIALSPDGKWLAAVDFRDPQIAWINTQTDEVRIRTALSQNRAGAFKPRFSPNGKYLFACNESEGLVNVLAVDNPSGPQRVIAVGKNPQGFAFSEDGKTVLVANHGEGTISLIDIGDMRELRKFDRGTGVESLAFY